MDFVSRFREVERQRLEGRRLEFDEEREGTRRRMKGREKCRGGVERLRVEGKVEGNVNKDFESIVEELQKFNIPHQLYKNVKERERRTYWLNLSQRFPNLFHQPWLSVRPYFHSDHNLS